jgi:parallel beta-helix repeat protein
MKHFSTARAAASLAIAVLMTSLTPLVVAQATTCVGTVIQPGADIQTAINAGAEGASFCLSAGTYNQTSTLFPKAGNTFTGMGVTRNNTVVKTTSVEIMFVGAGGNTFRHFRIRGAINECPGSNCGPTGEAINGGSNITVDDMHIDHNGRVGIGGVETQLTVTNSEIDHNGAKTGDGVSGGIKGVSPLTVTNSYVHDNINSGIWCDIQCGTYTVTGNTVINNTGNGIFQEISQGPAIIANNTVNNNNTAGVWTKGGISMTDSMNTSVYGNTLSGNKGFGIAARMDSRINCGTPSPTCGYVLSNISVHDNSMNLDKVVGCNVVGVLCTNNV